VKALADKSCQLRKSPNDRFTGRSGELTVILGNIPWKPADRSISEQKKQNKSVKSQGADQ